MVTLIIIKLVAFLAVLYKLVVTNHWSTGKKLLVGLTSALITEGAGLLVNSFISLPFYVLLGTSIPTAIIAVIMCYKFYESDFTY